MRSTTWARASASLLSANPPSTTAATRNTARAATLTLMIRCSGQRFESAMTQCHRTHVVVEVPAVEVADPFDHPVEERLVPQAVTERVLDEADEPVDVEPSPVADPALDQPIRVHQHSPPVPEFDLAARPAGSVPDTERGAYRRLQLSHTRSGDQQWRWVTDEVQPAGAAGRVDREHAQSG